MIAVLRGKERSYSVCTSSITDEQVFWMMQFAFVPIMEKKVYPRVYHSLLYTQI